MTLWAAADSHKVLAHSDKLLALITKGRSNLQPLHSLGRAFHRRRHDLKSLVAILAGPVEGIVGNEPAAGDNSDGGVGCLYLYLAV